MHKTLKDEATRPPQKDIRSQQREFDTFRIRFNTVRPHHAIGKMTPDEVYRPSPRPFPKKLPVFEYPDDFVIRKIHGHGCFIWHSKHVFVSRVFINERIALEPLGDGLYSVHFGPVLLARFDERQGRIDS